ncbi:hypothetical protein DPMN_156193 [Dreissena polymorpha]|uniref:Uncharacterized protein n=1 Tax=Dreissena polymorpha TaxID=45954 RepID=A0A9D4FTY2_DREPO|nr:hypothetical protein DPMN_156193 [Dreissena polymorpha]
MFFRIERELDGSVSRSSGSDTISVEYATQSFVCPFNTGDHQTGSGMISIDHCAQFFV